MTFLVERLADLRKHVAHLRELRDEVQPDPDALRADLSLHNDVLFSLLVVCQSVIDIAGELAARRGLRFQDYTEAVLALEEAGDFPPELVRQLSLLPGFRNVLIREYVRLDYDRVVEALERLDLVDDFARRVAELQEL